MGTMNKSSKLLILHGWATSTGKWGPFIKALTAQGLQPELLKIPGLTEKTDGPWDLDDYVKWLKEKVGNHKVILLGHSNGGRISLAFCAKYPEKVKNLILIDSAGIYHNELQLKIKRLLFKNIAKVGKKIAPSESLRNILYKLAGESDYKNADSLQQQTMINLISVDLTSILEKITVPTLIIWGENDKTTPLSDGKLMHKHIKDSLSEVIKNAKHSPQFTDPEKVAKIIHEYL